MRVLGAVVVAVAALTGLAVLDVLGVIGVRGVVGVVLLGPGAVVRMVVLGPGAVVRMVVLGRGAVLRVVGVLLRRLAEGDQVGTPGHVEGVLGGLAGDCLVHGRLQPRGVDDQVGAAQRSDDPRGELDVVRIGPGPGEHRHAGPVTGDPLGQPLHRVDAGHDLQPHAPVGSLTLALSTGAGRPGAPAGPQQEGEREKGQREAVGERWHTSSVLRMRMIVKMMKESS